MKDLKQVDYEFECEGLADFKYGIVPNKSNYLLLFTRCVYFKETNKELEESLVAALEKNDGETQILSMEEALSYIQPRSFTKGRNVFSQVKDPNLNIDFFSKALNKHI